MNKWKKQIDTLGEIIWCPYEDEKLAFWIKLVFGFIWAISIPNGLLFGAEQDYLIALFVMVTILVADIWINTKYQSSWIDMIFFVVLCLPVFFVYEHACIGYFSVMFPLIYACGIVFVLGIRRSTVINLAFLLIIFRCFRWNADSPIRKKYGDNIALRFPFLFVCIVLMAYCLMYIIQRYWVEKRNRAQILEQRITDERQQLDEMSMNVMNAMVHALGTKIHGEEEHYRCVAEYAREIASRKGLEERICAEAYSAGLLHEIGMIGIPDVLIQKEKLTDEQYEVFKTYVEKGYQIIRALQSSDTSDIADAVHYHREAYDGSGYPTGLSREDIPVLARILAVADYADRHIRRGEAAEKVAAQILAKQETLFEPESTQIMAQLLLERPKTFGPH